MNIEEVKIKLQNINAGILYFAKDEEYEEYAEAINVILSELQKQEKIINLMAKELYVEGYCKNINCKKCNSNKFWDCIKEHFTNKVEREGK